jgi:nitroreductase
MFFQTNGGWMLRDLVIRNRSYRRFDENAGIANSLLKDLVDLARLSPCAANKQALKFYITADSEINQKIFPHLGWAAYLKDWPGPKEGERPSGYIIILGDTTISSSFGCDHGIAAQSILLGAVENKMGGCLIASVDRPALREALQIPNIFEILLVIALGKPVEEVILETVQKDQDIRYWRDELNRHHVPKRKLDDIILE